RALLSRAPLDLRVNSLKADRAALELPEPGEKLVTPQGLRFAPGTQVEQWDAYESGLVEVQDLGSQIACMAVAAQPGEDVIDLCAGAGGKTLALAAAMENSGRLVASDTDRGRLSRLEPRAERAGAGNITSLLLDPQREWDKLGAYEGAADAVLIDAPCSGTGTWRRNPESRWRMNADALNKLTDTQDDLLNLGARLVKPGGRLIYVTCSLLDAEGPDRIARFRDAHADWQTLRPDLPLGRLRGEGTRLTPYHDGTDGFFIASLTLPC
ncbi:MAG: RsmB/NOP family class I SAM-dependent RNA methyltransferase, partial [Alteripontixanthobacter sp.]